MQQNRRLIAALAVLTILSAPIAAQVPPVDQLRRPGDIPLPAPEPERPTPDLRLPPAPPVPSARALSQGVRVVARAFRFVGNTVFDTSALDAIAAPFIGRELGSLDLDDLRVRLTRLYVDAGYINSGAVVPDQDVTEGTITIRIIEGRLSEIAVGGKHRYDPDLLRRRIGYGAANVLNVNRLQEHLQVLLQDPLIERIGAELAPGPQPGEAVLRAEVIGAPLFLAGITLSNERTPAVGADQVEGQFAVRNLLGRGEVLSVRPAATAGLRDLSFALHLPVTASGTALSLRTQTSRSHIEEAPLDQLDISARSRSIEVGLTHPVIQAPRRTLNLNASLARRSTDSYFLGLPSPFIPGAPDGRTTIGVLRFGIDGVERSTDRVLAGRLLVSHGIDAFGATIVGPGIPDSRYTSVLAQIQWIERLGRSGDHVVLRGEIQHANDHLLGPEKYSIGGVDSVRGYRKDIFVRDSGWHASIEFRHLMGHLPLRAERSRRDEGPVHLAFFFDTGRAWDFASTAGVARIASIGPGIRWEPAPGLEAQAYYGNRLHNLTTPTRTSQDRGFHIRVGVTRAF